MKLTAQVRDLIESSPARCGPVRVIAVDGPSGAGKTVLAGLIAEEYRCPVIEVEDLIPGWDGLAEAPRLLTEQILEPLGQGRSGAYRRWDWYADDWAEIVEVPPVELLLIEGCGSSVRPAGDYAAVRLWLDAPAEVRMARGLARDGETYRPYWQRWAAQEAALFGADGTAERADLRIDTS
ncbi:4-amino-4-deoxy-L-arabinose transferase [Enemella sp. A6]|uniref:4-amino-4-deoxy-L-arabinose transferase n=1 Tax=Enemella sp. A6 TaxID=3440152 RepID=UPI003EB97066